MFHRIKTKLEKKDELPTEDDNQKSVKNELTTGFSKILGMKKNQESDISSSKSDQKESVESREKNEIFESGGKDQDKISSLIRIIKSSNEKIIAPKLELSTGLFTYPQLAEIGEDPKNIQFLENLTSDSIDLLEKIIYERIAVCPQHPNSLEANVRLYCPKCSSTNVEKLHLFEHKACGYISQTKNFTTGNSELECPSCKKSIKDKQKELRIPAMWYNCNSCKEKFDEVIIKLYCRKFNHDFDPIMAGIISIPGFIMKDSQSTSDYHPSLLSNIKDLLQEYNFISEENHTLKGKSGHYHNIDLIATNTNTDTFFIYVLKSENAIEESGINSKIIQVLDCNPTKSVIIGQVSEKAKSLATRYDISIIESYEKDVVLSSLSEILIDTFTTEKLENGSHILKEENDKLRQKLEEEKLVEEKLVEEKLVEEKLVEEKLVEEKLVEEKLADRRKLEKERLEAEKIEAEGLEAEMQESKQKLEDEMLAGKQKLEAERQRLGEERKKAESLAAEKLEAEMQESKQKLENEMLAGKQKLEAERKRLESEQLAERKKLEEEKFADKLQLKAEKQRVENERKKVEKLEAERQRLEEEKKKAELLTAEKLESEEKRKEGERKQVEKRAKILKKLEETENQLRALKSSFDSDDEKEE